MSSGLCICKLCTCGRHHCPHQSIKKVPIGPCTISEYTNEYHKHALPPIHSYKPLNNYKKNVAPLEDKTNHRIDYVPYPVGQRYVHKADAYQPPEGEFEKNTTYTAEYIPKRGEKVYSLKKKEGQKDLAKFEGTPSYKDDYKKWPISPREQYGRPHEWMGFAEAFNGVPSYTTDYIKYDNVSPREAFRPSNQYQDNSGPFQSDTDYRRSYKHYPMEVKQAKEKIEWYPPAVPFQGDSTTKSDYKEKPLSINKSFKPLNTAKISGVPLASQTTQRADYLPWEVEKPYKHLAAPYQRPEGHIDSDTTYIREYKQYGSPTRTLGFKPNANRAQLAQFDAKTSYSDEFKRYQLAPRVQFGPSREWIPSDEPFETQTTHKLNYQPKAIEMRASFKQEGQLHTNTDPFNGVSTYKTEYRPQEIEVCPTTYMNTPRAKWEFTGSVNETGHLLVAPKNREISTNAIEVAVN